MDKFKGKKINMNTMGLEKLKAPQKEIATKMGYNGMFACRDTIQEIYDYVASTGDPRATVGLAMLQNFLALHVAKNYSPKA